MDDRSQSLLAGYPDHHADAALSATSSPATSSPAASSSAESSSAAGFWLTKKGGTLLGKSQRRWYGTFRLNFHRFDRFKLDLRGHTQP